MAGPPFSPDPPPDPLALMIRLLKLGSFVNMPMKEAVCDPAGLTPTELKVLMALAGEGPLAGHDVVGITGMPAMNVSRAISALSRRGWIEEARDPVNRRRRPVTLSDAGRAAYAGIERDVAALAGAVLSGIDEGQQRDFAKAADAIVDSLADWTATRHADMRVKG